MSEIRYSSRGQKIEDSDIFDRFIQKSNLSVDGKIVLLSRDNAEIIETLIKNDDDYFPFSKVIFECFGIDKIRNNIDNSLFAVAREIDRDNSTNVWRYNNRDDFYSMIQFILNPESNFFDRLERGDIALPDEIVEQCGSRVKSLSSKICKYLSEFAFQKDDYYINDSVVRHILLFYLDYYDIKHPNIKSIDAVNSKRKIFQRSDAIVI